MLKHSIRLRVFSCISTWNKLKTALRDIKSLEHYLSIRLFCISVFQFSHSVVSNSLWPHGLQHARLPCPSPNLRACSNSCPLSWWCHPTILFSVAPFSSCLQSFPTSGSFQMSQFFTGGGQSIGVSASASVLPVNIQDWYPLRMDWLDLLGSPCSPRTLKILLQYHSSKAWIL